MGGAWIQRTATITGNIKVLDTLGFSPGDLGAELINRAFNGEFHAEGVADGPVGITSGDDGTSGGNKPGELEGTPANFFGPNRPNFERARFPVRFTYYCTDFCDGKTTDDY